MVGVLVSTVRTESRFNDYCIAADTAAVGGGSSGSGSGASGSGGGGKPGGGNG